MQQVNSRIKDISEVNGDDSLIIRQRGKKVVGLSKYSSTGHTPPSDGENARTESLEQTSDSMFLPQIKETKKGMKKITTLSNSSKFKKSGFGYS